MKKTLALLLFLFFNSCFAQVSNPELFIRDISKIFTASMYHIFKNQTLINQKGGDKDSLFGDKFIEDIKRTYKQQHHHMFPDKSSRLQALLLKTVVEVMEENRTLINDDALEFKGLIPAIFAFQVSEKLSRKGVGIKIKFTNMIGSVRNPLNLPDAWETDAMNGFKESKLKPLFDDTSLMNDLPSYRYFLPMKLDKFCLSCHGKPSDNPLNKGKATSEYTHIDMTGFVMENWTLASFAGGLSITIYKKDFLELEELCKGNYISSFTCHFFSLE